MANCEICGEPMPEGETMFKFHGYSGPCPKPPLPKKSNRERVAYETFRNGFSEGHPNTPPEWDALEPWVRDAITVAYLQGKVDR